MATNRFSKIQVGGFTNQNFNLIVETETKVLVSRSSVNPSRPSHSDIEILHEKDTFGNHGPHIARENDLSDLIDYQLYFKYDAQGPPKQNRAQIRTRVVHKNKITSNWGISELTLYWPEGSTPLFTVTIAQPGTLIKENTPVNGKTVIRLVPHIQGGNNGEIEIEPTIVKTGFLFTESEEVQWEIDVRNGQCDFYRMNFS